MQLEYENVTAKITSVTPLSEKHGNKRVPAQSIIVKVVLNNRKMDFFDPDLRHAYYKVPEGKTPQPSLGMDPDDLEGLTEKRFPWMTQDIEVERELTGYVFTIDFGLGDAKSNIELDAKKIDNFKLRPLDHGLFELSHRYIVHPSTLEKGRIEELLQQEIKVKLKAPKLPEQGNLPLAAEPKRGRGRPSKKSLEEKLAKEGDPLAGSDLAQDETRIDPNVPMTAEAWPFPAGQRPDGDSDEDADEDADDEQDEDESENDEEEQS